MIFVLCGLSFDYRILEGYSEVSRKYSRMVAESTKLKESIATLKVLNEMDVLYNWSHV